jgi:cytochrome P450
VEGYPSKITRPDLNKRTDIKQAFSIGPRKCLGRNLAYMEMRLILARVLFNFDLELVDKDKDWVKGMKIYGFWEKPDLMVKLTPVSDH